MADYKKYLVTRVETVIVSARSESEAEFLGEQTLDFFGCETQDLSVEELDEEGFRPEPGNLED